MFLWRSAQQPSYVTSITSNALKNMVVTFLSDPRVYQFYLIQDIKISFVETGKKCGILYRKVPKFSDIRKLCSNLPKIQEKRQNHRVFRQKDAIEIANSEDPDQTAPLGAV